MIKKRFSNDNNIHELKSSQSKELINIDNNFFDVEGEQALWRAVIAQAFLDAFTNSNRSAERLEKARAISWLAGNSEGFSIVCQLAGVDKAKIIRKAGEFLKQKRKILDKSYFAKKETKSAEIIYLKNIIKKD